MQTFAGYLLQRRLKALFGRGVRRRLVLPPRRRNARASARLTSVDVSAQQPLPADPKAVIIIGNDPGPGQGPKAVVVTGGDPRNGNGPKAIVIGDPGGDGPGPKAVVIPSRPTRVWQQPS